ncbi:RES family NAD+ phosphorylase [soil metagenome]
MAWVYRVAKTKYPVFDGTGAALAGGRWNSPGHPVVYAAECLAASLLEILARAGRRQKLPGNHHCARAFLPEGLEVDVVEEAGLPGWDADGSVVARSIGDRWIEQRRTAILSVPAVTAKPFGRNLLLNPGHPEYPLIRVEPASPITWDSRLF